MPKPRDGGRAVTPMPGFIVLAPADPLQAYFVFTSPEVMNPTH